MIIRSFRSSASASLLAIALLLTSIPHNVLAKKDTPTISSNKFDQALENTFYFEDSDVILGYDRLTGNVWRSPDAGETWKRVEGQGEVDNVWDLWPHPHDNHRAYMLGPGKEHWITTDRGETWRKFNTHASADVFRPSPMAFHGRDPKKVIWNGETCSGLFCKQAAYYTDDDFKTVNLMGTMTRGCQWAVGTPQFGEEIAPEVETRVFCIVEGLYSPWPKDNRLIVSDDYFDKEEIEPELDEGRAVVGIISMASVKGYLLAAAKSAGTDELALFVTNDGSQWHRAEFGQHRIEEDAYTVLESTNYSMQIDVLSSKPNNPMGYLFTSNSNGTYFTRNIDHTNRNVHGNVDFEKISNIQGIVMVNTVENWKEVETSTLADKDVVTSISFDDGRTFQDMKVKKDRLHLHSVTEQRQAGRIYSSPAPGIVMGVGNTGKKLKKYDDGDLFVSDDAGLTWTHALDGPHLYEFGNQGAVIAAIPDRDETSHLQYSLDHGATWKKADLGKKITPLYITTAPDSTTKNFLIGATSGSGSDREWHMLKVDFEGLHERTCKDKDFERWPARVDEDGEPSCIMGHKQFYTRRKADAECFIEGKFDDPVPEFEPCTCTEADYECDFNYVRDPEDRSKCNPTSLIKLPEDVCKNDKDTFKGESGWRMIPGNECKTKGGPNMDKEIERPCTDASPSKPVSGDVGVEKTKFDSKSFAEWYYLEKGGNVKGDDETVVMRTTEGQVYITQDHGKSWAEILKDADIGAIVPNPNFYEVVYFLTRSKTVHYTMNHGSRFDKFEAPENPSAVGHGTLSFHPDYKDWLLWSGLAGKDDHVNHYYSTDRGDDWKTLARYTKRCAFTPRDKRQNLEKLVYCERYQDEDAKKSVQLVSSDNWFAESHVHFDDILAFATMAEFIIVAQKLDGGDVLKLDASVDGEIFAPAEFPRNFQVKEQQAYTVLDSSTHAVFLHVTVNPMEDREHGAIIKSNSNGTSYVLTIEAVNRDAAGYVDFEKMQGLEGVAMVNVVSNRKQIDNGKTKEKELKSMITHNDGAEWALLPPPKDRAAGGKYKCVGTANQATEKCSLHLHSYTERADKSATFGSTSAIGIMLGVGNVGDKLLAKDSDATDTFITRDAGITWKSVQQGSFLWEYGDQGSIIVIVPESRKTRSIFYTLDEGEKWIEYPFTDVDMQIDAITTVPSDRSMKFLLWGQELDKSGIVTVNLDFSGLKERQRACDLDEVHPQNKDYDLWEPKHPMQGSNCLFGHVSQYHRKRPEVACHNGKQPISHLHNIASNCTCTRQDFECDYNYQIGGDGTCSLVPGMAPEDHKQRCRDDPDKVEFWYPTGYRRIPLTTCVGGQELDKSESKPCPNHEDEYYRRHALSGVGLFFAIVLPLAAAGGVGYWVWQKWQRGNFGQIRLGESVDGQSPWISIPVTVISAVVAVASAVPLLAMSLWRSLKGYVPVSGGSRGRFGVGASGVNGGTGPYRSRDAFANRRQDYSSVVEDDELLGDGLAEGLEDEEADV